jgi:hypothetical protein
VPPDPGWWGQSRNFAQSYLSFWRSTEFALAFACAIAAWFGSGDMAIMIVALSLGWVFAVVGLMSSSIGDRAAISLSAIIFLIFFAEGTYLHCHFAVSGPPTTD